MSNTSTRNSSSQSTSHTSGGPLSLVSVSGEASPSKEAFVAAQVSNSTFDTPVPVRRDEHNDPGVSDIATWLMLDAAVENRYIPPHLTGRKARTYTLPPFPNYDGVDLCPPALVRPPPSEAFRSQAPEAVRIYDAVRAVGLPNYRGAKIPVQHNLNIDTWRSYAHLLTDNSLVPMLAYGFPAGYEASVPPSVVRQNHSSATAYAHHVVKYIKTGLDHRALIGPFYSPPFTGWTRANPLMTRPKRDSQDRRVILDLSFPLGSSVNSAIPGNSLDGAQFKLRLPTPDMLADKILQLGRGCMIYKIDLSRAYRQLRSDPLDWPLLGIGWENQCYLDTAIPFGLRHGASACQRTSEAVVVIADKVCGA